MVALHLPDRGRVVLLNPTIVDKSAATLTLWDDWCGTADPDARPTHPSCCFPDGAAAGGRAVGDGLSMSFPFLMVRVRRHAHVSVRFEDEDGREHLWTQLPTPLSELLQHELDHLDGILTVDRAVAPTAPASEGSTDAIVSRAYYEANKAALARQVDYVIA
jgi:hypothetical protein